MNEKYRSSCHNAEVRLHLTSDSAVEKHPATEACCYVCTKCGEACSVVEEKNQMTPKKKQTARSYCNNCEREVTPQEQITGWTTDYYCPHCWGLLDSETQWDCVRAEEEAMRGPDE